MAESKRNGIKYETEGRALAASCAIKAGLIQGPEGRAKFDLFWDAIREVFCDAMITAFRPGNDNPWPFIIEALVRIDKVDARLAKVERLKEASASDLAEDVAGKISSQVRQALQALQEPTVEESFLGALDSIKSEYRTPAAPSARPNDTAPEATEQISSEPS